MNLLKQFLSSILLIGTYQQAMAFDLIESTIKSGNNLCLLLEADSSVTTPLSIQSRVTAETSYYVKKTYNLNDQINHTTPANHCYDVKTLRDNFVNKINYKAESANRQALSNCSMNLGKNQLYPSNYTITLSNINNVITCRVH